jgi:hypothetical protein
MGKILRDLWICATSGTVLYHRVFDKKLDVQLFGGFMSALDSFATQLNNQGLSAFELGNKKFYFVRRKDLTFIANCDNQVKPKKAIEELEHIASHFTQTYSEEFFKNWMGNVDVFEKFSTVIENSLEDIVENFKGAFW